MNIILAILIAIYVNTIKFSLIYNTFSTGYLFLPWKRDFRNRKIKKNNICESSRVQHFISCRFIFIFSSLAVKTSASKLNLLVVNWLVKLIVSWLVTSYLCLILIGWERKYQTSIPLIICINSEKNVKVLRHLKKIH